MTCNGSHSVARLTLRHYRHRSDTFIYGCFSSSISETYVLKKTCYVNVFFIQKSAATRSVAIYGVSPEFRKISTFVRGQKEIGQTPFFISIISYTNTFSILDCTGGSKHCYKKWKVATKGMQTERWLFDSSWRGQLQACWAHLSSMLLNRSYCW